MAEILRSNNHSDPEIVNNAFKQYLKKSNKSIAKLFKTTEKVQKYIEVLL